MELSKEDLEKIIKGVAEVIGVKKESKNMALKDLVIRIAKRKEIEDIIIKKREEFIKTCFKCIELDETQRGIINLEQIDKGFKIKIYNSQPIVFEVTDNKHKLVEKENDYDYMGISMYDSISDNYEKSVIPNLTYKFTYEYSDYNETNINLMFENAICKLLKNNSKY